MGLKDRAMVVTRVCRTWVAVEEFTAATRRFPRLSKRLAGQSKRRSKSAPPAVGRACSGRRRPGRSPDRQLDDHLLSQRGVELVSRLNKAHRQADFRRGRRLGADDHIVRWHKPTSIRALDRQTYQTLPDSITVREVRIRVGQPDFRTRSVVVVTTLLDPQQATSEDLAALYRARWNAELDLCCIKSAMQMRELRCKTPELVHKKVWAHILAYNLIRTVMAQAAARHEIPPRSISFTGAMQTLEAFQPLLELVAAGNTTERMRLCQELLHAIARHRVGDRPDRYEPRLKKHRCTHYDWLTRPRAEIKRQMANGLTKN